MNKVVGLLMIALAVAAAPLPEADDEAAALRDRGDAFVFEDEQAPTLPLLSERAESLRSSGGRHRFVNIDAASALDRLPTAGSVRFELFRGVSALVDVVPESAPSAGDDHWIGRRDNAMVSLTRIGDGLEGRFQPGGIGFPVTLLQLDGPLHLLVEDATIYPNGLQPIEEDPAEAIPFAPTPGKEPAAFAQAEPAGRIVANAATYTIDVLVWYDGAALAHHGGDASSAELAITASIDATNAAAIVSGTAARFNLVGIDQTSWAPPADPIAALEAITANYDGELDEIHAARDAADADLVSFITDTANFCGVAWLPSAAPSAASDDLAFSYVDADCMGANLTVAHELGHNLGAGHDTGASQPGPGLHPYSQGYVDGVANVRTIMSYPTACPGCARIPHFSSSVVTYNGGPTGAAGIDNARTISESAPAVAAYRPDPCPNPPGDDFAGRYQLASSYRATVHGSTVCGTAGAEVYYTVVEPVQSIWFEWTAPVTGNATISTCSEETDFDTFITAYNDPLQNPIGGNDDGAGCADSQSKLVLPVNAGSTYFFAIDGYGAAAGDFELTVSIDPPGLAVLDDPCVVYDSTIATDTSLGDSMVGGELRTVQVAGLLTGQGGASQCIPAGAATALLRIASINPQTEGNLRMTPAGVPPTGGAGVVNYGAQNGLNNANMVAVPLSFDGAVDIEANTGPAGPVPTTDVRLVVVGYFATQVADPLRYVPVNPCAVTDSRPNKGADDSFDGAAGDGFWAQGENFPDFDVVGDFPAGQGGLNGVGNPNGNPTSCGVPASADAVMLNVVSVAPVGGPGWISVDTGGEDPIPEAVTPFAPLQPNMANGSTTVVALGQNGTISLDVDGSNAATRVRVEILGYFEVSAGLDFAPITPCAAFDSRPNKGAVGLFGGFRQHGPSNTTTYAITGDIPVEQGGVVASGDDPGTGTCGVPDGASAVLINVEAVNAQREGNFWVSAAGVQSTGGLLNFNSLTPKMNNANAVVVPLDAQGRLQVEINAGSFTPIGTEVAHARGVILGYYN